jgi:hypothetical protein
MLNSVAIVSLVLSILSFLMFVVLIFWPRKSKDLKPQATGLGDGEQQGAALDGAKEVVEASTKFLEVTLKAGPLLLLYWGAFFFILISILASYLAK